jgi:hypothetical protein
MKRGRGIKGLDDKSRGMEILMAEAFAKINPADPLILAQQAARILAKQFLFIINGENESYIQSLWMSRCDERLKARVEKH